MPNERISMSKLKQLIALQGSNLGIRAVARALSLSVGAVSNYLRAVRAAGISPADAEALTESELEVRVFGPAMASKPRRLVAPDCAWSHRELKRHRHVTLQLLREEYVQAHGTAAYRRSAFCQSYRAWGEAPEALDAPAALCRREALCRLCLADGTDLRGAWGGVLPGAAVRGCGRKPPAPSRCRTGSAATCGHWNIAERHRRCWCRITPSSGSPMPTGMSRNCSARMTNSPPITGRSLSRRAPTAPRTKVALLTVLLVCR
jgi:hypothetical protein